VRSCAERKHNLPMLAWACAGDKEKQMSQADSHLRDQLKRIRDDLHAERVKRNDAKKERDAAKDAFVGVNQDGAQKITEMPEFANAQEATRRLGVIDDRIESLKADEQGVLGLLGEMLSSDTNGNGNGANPAADGPLRAWDGHGLLASSEEFKAAMGAGVFNSRQRFGSINIGEIADRNHLAQFLAAALPGAPAGPISAPTAGGALAPDIRGIIPPLLKPLSLLDLIPSGVTDSNMIQYVQVTGIPAGAAETDQLALKPQEGLSTIDATAPVRTVAGWIKAARQQLDDIAGLATLINTLLPYDVRRRIEAQMLAGDGTGQNLLGITNTAGVGAPTAVDGDNAADAVLRAMTVIVLSDAEPNFVTMNPLTVQDIRLMKNTVGSYLYGSPSDMITPSIWGLTITSNRLIPQANPLVGDSMGAALLVREAVNVKTSDADQDDFIRNRVTVLAEARVAFPVWRPVAFCVASQG
jgi:HK97 family phage major capsid protein